MSAVAVLRLPLAVDLSGFVKLLQRMQVPHRVSEESGEQVLWVPANISEDVRSLYERFPAGDPDQQLDIPVAQTTQRPGFVEQLRYAKATAAVLLLSILVGAVTLLGENLDTMRWLTFLDFRVVGEYIHFVPLAWRRGSGGA
jgi:GlpG protein